MFYYSLQSRNHCSVKKEKRKEGMVAERKEGMVAGKEGREEGKKEKNILKEKRQLYTKF